MQSTSYSYPVSTPLLSFKGYTVVGYTFFLFVFTIPFEAADLGVMSGYLSPARITGLIFLASCLLYPRDCFSSPPVVFYWFLGYLYVYGLSGFFVQDQLLWSFFTRLLTMAQLVILFWIASNLLKDEHLARNVLLIFSAGAFLSALAMISGVSGFSSSIHVRDSVRMTALGWNPNNFSIVLAIAIIVLVGLALDNRNRKPSYRVWLIALTGPLLMAMIFTGSRAGAAAVLFGLALYLLPYRGSKRTMIQFFCATLGIVAVVYLITSDQNLSSRWTSTIQRGDVVRDKIYSAAVDMIVEQPILGWQPIEFLYELGNRTGRFGLARGAHNLFLNLLLEVGLVGTLPFLVGLWWAARAAWKARKGNWGMLPIALLATMLIGNLTHTFITSKLLWLVLAFAFAAASSRTSGNRGRRFGMSKVNLSGSIIA